MATKAKINTTVKPSQEALNAVKLGYVKSPEEYMNAEAEGRAGAQYGYENIPSLSSTRGIQAIKSADKKLSTLKGETAITTPVQTKTKATPVQDTTQSTDDFVELYNPTNERTVRINKATQNQNQIKTLMESGFEVTESNTSAPIQFQSGQVLPTQTDFNAILAGEQKKLERFKTSGTRLSADIDDINAAYDTRKELLNQIGDRRKASFETLGYRTGGQFSGGIRGGVFGGVVSEEERQTQMKLNELDDARKAQIKAAETAAAANDWSIYVQAVKNAEKIFNDQLSAAEDYNKAVKAQNDKIQQTLSEVSVQSAIIDLYKQGVTDPADIFNYMNYDEQGNQIGDVSYDTVQSLMDDITKGSGASFSTTQKLKLEQAGLAGSSRQEQLDFLFGKKGGGSSEESGLTWEEFLKSPTAQQTIAQSKDIPQDKLEEILRDTYNQNVDNPFFQTKNVVYTATSIPPNIKADLVDDISAGSSLADLYDAYPDVSTSYLSSLYNSLNKENSGSGRSI